MEQWLVNKEDLPEGIVEFSELLCGCGDPQICWEYLHKYLQIKAAKEFYIKTDNPCQLFFMYAIEHLKFTEHGSIINGAWITGNGRKVLMWLKENVNKSGDLVVCY